MNNNTKNLYSIKEVVSNILIENDAARDNDCLLYKEVCRKMNPSFLRLNFETAMDNAMFMNMPTFESVRRARQKLQHEAPLIYGTHHERCKFARLKKQEEYLEFARS